MNNTIEVSNFKGIAEAAAAWERMAEDARREREEMDAMDAWVEGEMLKYQAKRAKIERDFGDFAEEYADELQRLRWQYEQKLAEAEDDLRRMYKARWKIKKAYNSVKSHLTGKEAA